MTETGLPADHAGKTPARKPLRRGDIVLTVVGYFGLLVVFGIVNWTAAVGQGYSYDQVFPFLLAILGVSLLTSFVLIPLRVRAFWVPIVAAILMFVILQLAKHR